MATLSRPTAAPALDFVVIGAAKAGTTALFSLIRTHPALHLPEGKELPYFVTAEHAYYQSPAEFYTDAFQDRGPGQLCGTVTPQYLYGTLLGPQAQRIGSGSPEKDIPSRIRDAYPEARLIAILRDPVARARSYHRMSTMRGQERRPFDLAIDELLRPEALSESRARPTVKNSYVVLGEYARLLEGFFDVFPREQLLVLFHDDLERDPAAVCEAVFSFLGVDPGFRPPNLGRRYNEKGRAPALRLDGPDEMAAGRLALGNPETPLAFGAHILRLRTLKRFDVASGGSSSGTASPSTRRPTPTPPARRRSPGCAPTTARTGSGCAGCWASPRPGKRTSARRSSHPDGLGLQRRRLGTGGSLDRTAVLGGSPENGDDADEERDDLHPVAERGAGVARAERVGDQQEEGQVDERPGTAHDLPAAPDPGPDRGRRARGRPPPCRAGRAPG